MEFFIKELGDRKSPVIVWGHGWGHTHAAFLPLAESLGRLGRHILIDFPGFGQSPKPETDWDVQDYADAVAAWIKTQDLGKIIWVGHSFGGRVGIRLAAKHPELVSGLFLIAAAGLQRKRPLHKKIYFRLRIKLFKALKAMGLNQDWLRSKFGSRDYNNAGPLRGIFLKTISEDLTDIAQNVRCPVELVYGAGDTETPPEFGERYSRLIPGARVVVLEGEDHYSVLGEGRHQVAALLADFINKP